MGPLEPRLSLRDIFRDRDFDQRQTSQVRVQVMFPIEATPQVLAEIEKDKSRRELISRVTGNPAAALNDPIMFPAERKQLTLSQKTIRLRPEHCELLEQMIPAVFRELDIKVVRRQLALRSLRALALGAEAHGRGPLAGRRAGARREREEVDPVCRFPGVTSVLGTQTA